MSMDATSTGKIGRYTILRVLGRGGMGEVLLAQDEDLGRRVAIKRPFKSAMEEGLARFQVEAKAAVLKHPNIPAVYEMGEQDGLPFIAMEFVEGEPLDKIIASKRPLELITKLSIIEQVCLALGHAHEKGIIHRDIKPANVIVQPDGVAKIIDFGIAKLQNVDVTRGLTQTQQIIGSLHYIAPERFRGEAVDGRADIFSAGVMLYLLLTGELPFGGSEVTASFKIVNEAHSSLNAYIHDYPPALDGILDLALAKNPYDRYSMAEDFAEALHEVIEDLKKHRVTELFDNAERLATESRYAPALELLDEAIKLDPNNTQVRKLRRLLKEHQDRQKRADRAREFSNQADAALALGNFVDALTALREAQRLDATNVDLRNRIQAIEDQKRKSEKSASALAEAETARSRGDVTGALKIVERALAEDPESTKLLTARSVISRQIESEAKQGQLRQLVDDARRELAAQRMAAAEQLLREAEAIDPSHAFVDDLRRDLARVKEADERRQLLEEIQRRINDFLRANNYEAAQDLLNRAIDKLPNESMLHRLKVDVDAEARKFDAKRFVDNTLIRARDLFATSPAEALTFLQKAIDDMPGEERLIAYERSLRQQAEALRLERAHTDALRKARELMEATHFDKAIEVLEGFQLEFGRQAGVSHADSSHADIDHLLGIARAEHAERQRRVAAERCMATARSLIEQERYEEATQTLEAGAQATRDASVTRLLEETRGQQVAAARKREALERRIAALREHGELDEAIQLLEEQMAATKNHSIQDELTTLRAEREQRQAVQRAIEAARSAAQRQDFAAGLEALHAVVQAYGESPEMSQERLRLEAERIAAAQEKVGQSIESARAAVANSNPEAALAALKDSAGWVEFADAKRQTEWQRIAAAAQESYRKIKGAKPEVPALVAAPQSSTGKTLMLALVGCAVIAAGGVFAWWKLQTPLPPPVKQPRIEIAKAPRGAQVKVGNLPVVTVDANGNASIPVQPGKYHIEVSLDGYAPFTDDLDMVASQDQREPIPALTPLSNLGFLSVKATGDNPGKIKVYVAGQYKGTTADGKPFPMAVGNYMVHYSAVGFDESADKSIIISRGATTSDTYALVKLKAPPPSVGNLRVHTQPGAQVTLDGGQTVTADNGTASFQNLPPAAHRVDVSLDGYTPVKGQSITIAAGQNNETTVTLVAQPPQVVYFNSSPASITEGESVTLKWQVNRATTVTIDPLTGSWSAIASTTDKPTKATTYSLKANGVELDHVTVDVKPKASVVAAHPEPVPPANLPPATPQVPDRDELYPVVNAFKGVYVQARQKGDRECQSFLSGVYGGALKPVAIWCSNAKKFEADEKCTQASGGTATAPTLACTETLRIFLKVGQTQTSQLQRTFHFSKGTTGTWQVTGIN